MATTNTGTTERTCFVVGPIGSTGSETRVAADFLLNGIIREALKDVIVKIWRADEDARPGMITDKVITDIHDSDLVIADLSELNPNVFYELGIRHAAAKPTIHVAASGTKLPFDNIGHRVIFYDRSNWSDVLKSRSSLKSQFEEVIKKDFQVSNPVTQALSAKAFQASASSEDKIIATLMERVGSLEKKSQDIEPLRKSTVERDKKLITVVSRLDNVLKEEEERRAQLREIAKRFSTKYNISDETISSFAEINSDRNSFYNIVNAIANGDTKFVVNSITDCEIPF